MKLLKPLFFSLSLLLASNASAQPNYNKIFEGVKPCFILYDLNKEKTVEIINSNRCNKRIAPCSTFKVALSLIGFDSGILKDEDNPKWKFKPEYSTVLEVHAKDHTPKGWMANSVVWYSQVLTQELGMEKFENYIARLSYGNRDLTGNLGKEDGLTHSWLNSSLKISANEQIEFLNKMIAYKLPISKSAIDHTKNIMFIEKLANGYKLYGKTGSALQKNTNGSKKEDMWLGWFIGFLEKPGQTYIFALNILDKQESNEYGGLRAKAMAKEIFESLDALK
ncbi:hypothetical protein I862_01170 [endosymbiont of Acanthamoeba sp. UWC8]|uniref:class D beta-lactamase n=1 Tax=endosymbiont of Acanthamoeba sp. UWC8 TaxID=86106 RepID=UPI0004D1EC05|nr:class D beta-lactamase [endosymbiont of Acanthamoeba sp. UWC8]AIF80797.1 hypothetical protein I862_01170 [endosymbiont of Acanthamoeba sp. UWC8]